VKTIFQFEQTASNNMIRCFFKSEIF